VPEINPTQSLNRKEKLSLVFILAGLVAVTPFTIDAYMPAFGSMAQFFAVDFHTIELTVSIFFIGSAFGQLLFAPYSDRIGRRPVLFTALILYLMATFCIIVSSSINQLLIFRFLQAVACGCVSVTGLAIVRDLFNEQDSARMISAVSTIMMAAPFAAPFIGAGLLALFNWQAIFWFLLAYCFIVIFLMIWKLPETIIDRETLTWTTAKQISFGSIDKFKVVFSNQGAMVYLACLTFCSAWLLLYLTDAAFIYLEYFGVSQKLFPFLFGSVAIAVIVANFINLKLLKYFHARRIFQKSVWAHFILTACLLLYIQLPTLNLWITFGLILVTQSCLHLVTANGMANYLSYYSDNSGSATAIFGTMRFLFGGLMGVLLSFIHNKTLLPFAGMTFLCLIVAFVISFKLDLRPIEEIQKL